MHALNTCNCLVSKKKYFSESWKRGKNGFKGRWGMCNRQSTAELWGRGGGRTGGGMTGFSLSLPPALPPPDSVHLAFTRKREVGLMKWKSSKPQWQHLTWEESWEKLRESLPWSTTGSLQPRQPTLAGQHGSAAKMS